MRHNKLFVALFAFITMAVITFVSDTLIDYYNTGLLWPSIKWTLIKSLVMGITLSAVYYFSIDKANKKYRRDIDN